MEEISHFREKLQIHETYCRVCLWLIVIWGVCLEKHEKPVSVCVHYEKFGTVSHWKSSVSQMIEHEAQAHDPGLP